MLALFPMFSDVFPPMTEKDIAFSRKFIRLFVDFGRNNKPTLEDWKPLSDKDGGENFLQIDEHFTIHTGLPDQKRIGQWRDLPPVYWRHTVPNFPHIKDPKPYKSHDEL